ncbi:MAG: hypothetical protein L0229_05815, partial [Blastocatellia bacterium]|nr:hypothetical protein [Blastocatellia bacterium]
DGRKVITGSDDRTAKLWSAESGQALATLQHNEWVRAVAFSPDGQIVLTATDGWLHASLFDGAEVRPLASRLLRGAWVWQGEFYFMDPSADQIKVAVKPTGNSIQIITLRLDRPDAEPVEGDPTALLEEWQKRLGLRINEAGEIVPIYQ